MRGEGNVCPLRFLSWTEPARANLHVRAPTQHSRLPTFALRTDACAGVVDRSHTNLSVHHSPPPPCFHRRLPPSSPRPRLSRHSKEGATRTGPQRNSALVCVMRA